MHRTRDGLMAGKSRGVEKTPAAVRDLIEIGDYLAQVASLAMAERFIDAAEATFERLARLPGIGAIYESDDPAFEGFRHGIIDTFSNYVVFYRPTDGGIEVVRVLHGARDLGMALGGGE